MIKHEATGTILIVDSRASAEKVSALTERALGSAILQLPFKVPYFLLYAGVVKDEFVFPWDGVKEVMCRTIKIRTLRSAGGHSALWVYENLLSDR